jgi:hypothetical protein
VTRRDFGLSIGALSSGLSAANQLKAGTPVDQNTVRRRGTGLRALDPARTSPGLTLFTPSPGDGSVWLINANGKPVHSWRLPYPGQYAYITEQGTLFFNGKIPGETFIAKAPFGCGVALEADWNGRILWEVRNPNHHHDGRLLKNGNVILLCAAELPADVAARVKGGMPGTEVSGRMWADYLVEVTKEGRTVWECRTWEHLDPAEYPIPLVQNLRAEWTHGNSVIELSDGNLLISFRNISTVMKIDRSSGRVLWKLGTPTLSGQHAPVELPNGNILIFDNGPTRLDQTFPFSRVIEVDPATNEIAWEYHDGNPQSFYSDRISNAQRLPNGNTLINEGMFGRFFEVTPAGEVVWEYVNPHFGPASKPPQTQTNSVFRVYRYSDEEVSRARRGA